MVDAWEAGIMGLGFRLVGVSRNQHYANHENGKETNNT